MPYSQIFSNFHYYNHGEADDSSSVFDADTVVSVPDDEVPVPSLPLPLPMPTLTVTATDSYNHHHQLNNSSSNNNNNNNIGSSHPYPSQEEESRSPPTSISEFLRRHGHINDSTNRQRHAIIPSMATAPKTTAATNTRRSDSEEISSSVNALNNLNHQIIESSSTSLSSSQSSIITKRNNSLFSCPPSTNCRRKNEANEARWKEKFQELCAYKQQHGHTSIPRSDKQLGMWVGTQRTQYNYFQQNKHSNMTDERIEMLDSIGFEWVANNYNNNRNNKGKIQNPNVLQAHDLRWIKRFEDLLRFKSKYGHVNVSTTNHRDLYKQLAYWVSTQRYQYKLFQRNEGKANITRERIEILNAIGFQWSLKDSYRT